MGVKPAGRVNRASSPMSIREGWKKDTAIDQSNDLLKVILSLIDGNFKEIKKQALKIWSNNKDDWKPLDVQEVLAVTSHPGYIKYSQWNKHSIGKINFIQVCKIRELENWKTIKSPKKHWGNMKG